MQAFQRITFDPRIMGGQACIRGLRITAALIIRLVAQGRSRDAILAEYPDLEPEDIHEALSYAAWLASDQVHVERAA
ncbi:hypothetical protein CCR95_07980 [Thiocystis minor]|nr:DUF433 domain-containing protein [Thiocystis minor]MBK5964027.1 hypothetical protein [Thiocystis minor]